MPGNVGYFVVCHLLGRYILTVNLQENRLVNGAKLPLIVVIGRDLPIIQHIKFGKTVAVFAVGLYNVHEVRLSCVSTGEALD